MFFVYVLLMILPMFLTVEAYQSFKMEDNMSLGSSDKETGLAWMTARLSKIVDTVLPMPRSCTTVEGRKRKKHKLNKYVLPLIVGFLLIKSILLPIALKALAVLSGKAVVLSLMSLILAAIVGLKKVAQSPSPSNYEVVNLPLSKYRRQDPYDFAAEYAEEDPYKYYRDRRVDDN